MDSWRDFLAAHRPGAAFLLIAIFALHLTNTSAASQNQTTITGAVTDFETGEPLVGANVVVRGTPLGAAAGPDGRFEISGVPAGEHTVVASFIGYHTQQSRIHARPAGVISGKVIDDQSGQPLSGIKVSIKGTSQSTLTGSDGSYRFSSLAPGDYTLQVQKQGYQPLESIVRVKANVVNFALRPDILQGEAVVVTGIASRTTKSVAEVAVSRIAASNYTEQVRYSRTSQLINGKLAGVQVKRASGNVGAGFRFDMRSGGGLNGDEQPVIYIDGVRMENAEVFGFEVGGQGMGLLAELNPEEIDHIEVLKGPAAGASYGTDGANGVVLITTKRGQYGTIQKNPLRLNYKLTVGRNSQSYDYSTDDLLSAEDANAIFRDGSIIQNTFSASGGSDLIRYFAAFDARSEEGILKPDRLDRNNVRANFDVIPSDKLTFQVSTSYALTTFERPSNDNNIFGYLINTTIRPTSYQFVGGGRSAIENIRDENETNRFIGSLRAEFEPAPFFTTSMSFGIDDHDLRQDQLYPVNETYDQARFDAGVRNLFTRQSRLLTYNFDGRLRLNPRPGLRLSVVAGTQLFDRELQTFSTQRFDFLTQLATTITAGTQQSSIDEFSRHERKAGLFSEASVALHDQYFMSIKLRRDYASQIGRDASSIFYPGASLAVRMDKYDWFPQLLNLLKLRAAYGETGILPQPLDGIHLHFRPETGGYGAGGVPGNGGNRDLKPERVKELELGFDAELSGALALEFTYYRQRAENSIFEIINSPSTGLPPTPVNVGEIEGSGIETLLHATVLRKRNVDLSMILVNNWRENEVTDIGSSQPIFDSFGLNVITEGVGKHEFYTEPFLGALFFEDGTYFGPDFGDEPTAHGNPIPSYSGSLSFNLRLFKNLTLFGLADWATGHKIWNGGKALAFLAGNNPRYNLLATQLGIAGTFEADGVAFDVEPVEGVTPFTPGTERYIAAAEEFARMDPLLPANFIEDADFLKLREISIGYNFRDIVGNLFGGGMPVREVSLILSGYNLLTATKYSGPEVEVNWSGARDLERGQDYFTLQSPRTYNLTLSVSF